MSELKDIFNAFNNYEEAIFNEVDYKITINGADRKNYRTLIETRKSKKVLYETITQFVNKSQNKNTRTFQNRRSANTRSANTRKRLSILL